jgi:hypothetical protein
MNINKIVLIIFVICSSICNHRVLAQEIRTGLNLEENFKGFLWEYPEDAKSIQGNFKINILIPPSSDIRMTGLRVLFNNTNKKIESIEPIVGSAEDLRTRMIVWSINAFQEKKISFDALWEITRTNIDGSIIDKDVFIMLHDAVMGSDDPNITTSIPICSGGVVEKALVKLGWKDDEKNKLNISNLFEFLNR